MVALARSRFLRVGIVLGIALALMMGLHPFAALLASDGPTQISVWPELTEVLVGRTGYIELRVADAQDLYAAQLRLTYDPSIVQITDANPALAGPQIGAGDIFDGLPWHEDINQVNPASGVIDYVLALDSQAQGGVHGDGSLARIDFTALQPGASPIVWVEVILARQGGESIERTTADGHIRVVSIPFTATATVAGWQSPTPTQTPLPRSTSTPGGLPEGDTPTSTSTPTLAVAPSVIYIDPELRYVRPGLESYVDIRIANAPSIYAVWVRVSYDRQILEVLDQDAAQPGTQIAPGDLFAGQSAYLLANQVDSGTGIITYAIKLSFAESPTSDGGQVARIHFRALTQGVSPVQFLDVILADQQGVSIEAEQRPGTVSVTTILPTNTPSPTPTQTPGGVLPSATPTATSVPAPAITPVLYLVPDAQSLAQGGEATIDLRVDNVTNLYGVEFHLTFDPTVISIVDQDPATAGIQLAYGGFLTPDSVAQNNVNTTAGIVNLAISQFAPTPPRSGSGVIARMRVRGLAQGASALAFRSSQLQSANGQSLAHGTAGGFVAVNVRTVTGRVLMQGRTLHSGVAIKQGAQVLATTGADGGFAFACPVSEGASLSLVAEHTGYLPAAMAIIVPVDQVVNLGQTTLLGGDAVGARVTATRSPGCPGDATVSVPGTSDQRINILDLTFVAGQFGIALGDPTWAPTADGCHPEYLAHRADINGDLVCNIFDLVQVGNNFGMVGSQPW